MPTAGCAYALLVIGLKQAMSTMVTELVEVRATPTHPQYLYSGKGDRFSMLFCTWLASHPATLNEVGYHLVKTGYEE